ncbi:MAG: nucleotidyltransferase domain-containing protein [Bdellovibrionota bacterium]
MKNLYTSDAKLTEIVKKLTDRFKPKKVYLFGSRAKGTERPNSDYDLFLIVEKSDLPMARRMAEAEKTLWGLWSPIDVFIYTEEEFEEWKNELNTVANTVFSEGRELPIG